MRTPSSRHGALALALIAALALPLHEARAQQVVPAQPVRLPSLGESAAEDFTVNVERRLGDRIMGEVRRDPDYLDDPQLLAYLQSLWQPLVQAARARGEIDGDTERAFAWESFLVRDRSVNAFALPGGFVGVHLGLIAMTTTRDELASVLAHELTHVTQRHIARGIAAQQRQSLLGIAGMILALLAASRSRSPDAAQAAVMTSQAAMVQGQLNFSRDMEREADRVGYATLTQAGFSGHGMPAMFEKLDAANRLNDSGAFPYLRSHPLTFERQAEARLRAQGAAESGAPAQVWLHALMAARARVLMDGGTTALRRWQEPAPERSLTSDAERLGVHYAAALASARLREPAAAQARLAAARALLERSTVPDGAQRAVERQLVLLDAELRLAAGDAQGAWRVLEPLRGAGGAAGNGGDADVRAPLMLGAQAALQAPPAVRGDALRTSIEALQTWVALHPTDAMGWSLLGNAAEAAGLRLRALRAQAEARWLVGDLTGALDRLKAARGFARSGVAGQDFIEASIIDARLRDLETERRALIDEARGSRRRSDDAPPSLRPPGAAGLPTG